MTPKAPPPASKTSAVFVDDVEEGRARLLLGDDAFTVPAALLPDGTGEGTWLKLTATVTPGRSSCNRRPLSLTLSPLRGARGPEAPRGLRRPESRRRLPLPDTYFLPMLKRRLIGS